MSLRAEYSRADVFNEESRKWEVTVFHHQNEKAKVVGRESVNFEYEIPACANRIISAHMEKVTHSLGLGSRENVTEEEQDEEDRLAHKADHDNQVEKDLE